MNQKDSTWLPPAKNPMLDKNEIHVWRTYLNLNKYRTDHLFSTLSSDEKSKANRFRFENDKKRFIVTRGLLRETLGRYLSIEPENLNFTYNKYGKPSLTNQSSNKVEFNLSHSGEAILFAYTKERKVGIDVERVRSIRKADKIVERFFSEKEKQYYQTQSAEEQELTFFKLWTYKEAYTKAIGLGLALPLNQFEVPLLDAEPMNWSWYQIDMDSEYIAAIAAEGSDFKIKHWDYCAVK